MIAMCSWSSSLVDNVHNFRMAGTTILKVTYGFEGLLPSLRMLSLISDLTLVRLFQVLEKDDPWIELNENLHATLKHLGAAGAHPADIFPSRMCLIFICRAA